MTRNQRKLIAAVMAAKETTDYDARRRGVELFGHWHRTAKSLQARQAPIVCIEDIGDNYYRPYAFYVHNPLICACEESVLIMPYIISFCIGCKGVVKSPDWWRDVNDR